MQDTNGENKKTTIQARAAVLFFRVLFRPMSMISRLMKDDRKLIRYNERYLPKPQWVFPSRERKVAKLIQISTILLIMSCLVAIGLGLGTTGRGPEAFFYRLFKNFQVGRLSDLVNVWILAIMGGLILFSNIHYWWLFKRRGSKLQRMLKALKDNGLESKEGAKDPWYYEGVLLHLDLIGTTGEEIVKREATWNQAGFKPTKEPVIIPGTNETILTAAPQKPTESTMIYDRYEEWSKMVQDEEKLWHWYVGEYVEKNEFLWKDSFDSFSTAFVGTSGSGKTEAMKCWLTMFLCKHPFTRLIICDLKGTGDWNVFGPLTEFGRIIKDSDEVLKAILAFHPLIEQRKQYMAEKGYNGIRAWGEAEGVEVPPILLIIDEFPQLFGPLKYDIQSRKLGSPANVLFRMLTLGRSYGLWFGLGSQFSGSDAIPTDLNKNIKVHTMLRTGSEGESMTWLNSGVAFRLGKDKRKPNGEEDSQQGYAYIDSDKNFVRFWYMHDWYIVHELKKYGVAPIEGHRHFEAKPPGIPKVIASKLKAKGGDRKKLNVYDRRELDAHESALARFEKSFIELEKSPNPRLLETKKSCVNHWTKDEGPEEYLARVCQEIGLPVPEHVASKAGGGGGGMGGGFGGYGGGFGGGGDSLASRRGESSRFGDSKQELPGKPAAGQPEQPKTGSKAEAGRGSGGDSGGVRPTASRQPKDEQKQDFDFDAMIARRRAERQQRIKDEGERRREAAPKKSAKDSKDAGPKK